jgi:hypothetical protein
MDTQNRSNALFPRVANGNQSNAVQQANAHMSAAFGNRVNNRSATGSQNLFNIIQQILNQLWNRPANPAVPDMRAVYGAPVPNPTPAPPDNRAIYGAPVPNPTPAPPDNRAIYGAPVPNPTPAPPDNRAVYGTPVVPSPNLPIDGGWAQPVYGAPVVDQPVDLNGGDALPVYGGPNIPKDLVLPQA